MNKNIVVLFLISLISFNAHSIEPGPISASKEWTAEVVENHLVWNKTACVAYTKTSDDLSTLEITSIYNEETDTFSEPTINILTPFDVVFFEVNVRLDRINDAFSFFPMIPERNTEIVGARAMFDDRQFLIDALKGRNVVNAKYFDASGEVKALSFSLSGSGATITNFFEACELQITERENLEPLTLD